MAGLLISAAGAHAQVGAAARGLGYLNQTDVAASIYGSFAGTTSANGVVQSPSSSAGILLELRHLSNPLLGYELTYSYNRANESYNTSPVKAVAHEVGADYVVSFGLPVVPLKVFGLAGGGLLFVEPDSGQSGTQGNTKAVFVYGAGLDYSLIPHLGLRLQYRGNLYRAPDLLHAFTSTQKFTTTSQPMLGAYFRF
jgi:opacity protein-like surface antigen